MKQLRWLFLLMIPAAAITCRGQAEKTGHPADNDPASGLSHEEVLKLIRRDDTIELPAHLKKGYDPFPFHEKTRQYGTLSLHINREGHVRYDYTDPASEINIMELPYNTLLYSTDYGPKYRRSAIIQRLDYYDADKQKVLYTTDLVALNPYRHLPMIDTTFPDFVDTYNLLWDEDCDYSNAPQPDTYIIDTEVRSSHYGYHQVVYRLFGVATSEGDQVVSLEETIIILDQKGKPVYTYKWDKILNGSVVSSDGTTWILTSQDYGGPLGKCRCMMQIIDITSGKTLYKDEADSNDFDYSGPSEFYKKDFFTGGKNDLKSDSTLENIYIVDCKTKNIFIVDVPKEDYENYLKKGNRSDFYADLISTHSIKQLNFK